MLDGLKCQRALFDLPPNVHYLNCAYAAPLMRPVESAAAHALLRLRSPQKVTADDFFRDAEHPRTLFARLINADADGIALVPSVSYGIALAARNVRVSRGDNIVIAEGQFPSNVYAWRRLCDERGATLRTAPRCSTQWSTRILDAIDARTAVVALGTIDWTDGTVFDLDAISKRARDVGAALVLDGIQSLGAMPFDARSVQPDFLVTSSYKWLLGPMGLGLCYISPRFRDATPLEETWLGRLGSEDFSRLTDYADDYQPGARRFDAGGRAQFVLLPMLNAALQQLLDWDPSRIQHYASSLAQPLRRELTQLGFSVSDGAPHLFAVRPSPPLAAQALHAQLKAHGVHVSVRGNALRVSINVFNNQHDIDALLSTARLLSNTSRANSLAPVTL
jgi:selenocysteine lyase/cysteine desulfurase